MSQAIEAVDLPQKGMPCRPERADGCTQAAKERTEREGEIPREYGQLGSPRSQGLRQLHQDVSANQPARTSRATGRAAPVGRISAAEGTKATGGNPPALRTMAASRRGSGTSGSTF